MEPKAAEKLEISTSELPELDAWLVRVSGAVDLFSYKDLKEAMDALGGRSNLLLDMSGATYVGSSGWSVIFLQGSVQDVHAGALVLFNMAERVRRSLDIIMPRKRRVNVAADFESAKALLQSLKAPEPGPRA